MAGQTTAASGAENAPPVDTDDDEDGTEPTETSCYGCGKPITTFSGERRFCLPCTRVIIRENIARHDFAEGCLRVVTAGQQTLDDWSVD
jgi:hypothetical protein